MWKILKKKRSERLPRLKMWNWREIWNCRSNICRRRNLQPSKKKDKEEDWPSSLAYVGSYFILNYLDRNNICRQDLGTWRRILVWRVLNIKPAFSILFVGYILMQIPANMLFEQRWLDLHYLYHDIWGIISTCTVFDSSFGGFICHRFC